MKIISTDFEVSAPDTDESIAPGTPPGQAVSELALRKALAVAEAYPDRIVIGADTVVVLGDRILGKPASEENAMEMLRALSGKSHFVYTGVAIIDNTRQEVFREKTEVWFRELSNEEISAYVSGGEPMDKAGAYGIQGQGALLVTGINGDYYNVMGLPVCRLAQKLASFRSEKE